MQTLLFTLVFNIVGFNFYLDGARNNDETPAVEYNSIEMRRALMVDSLMTRATQCLGARYQYGGTSKSGFDCSGFMNYVFSAFEIEIPRSSPEISKLGVMVEFNDLQPGDLVFF
jgi:hypothetical protein